jgi:hypothetical protein
MDEGVDQVLGRSTTETGAEKAVAMRKSQQKERTRIQNEILQSQKSITELNDARAPIATETRKLDAEVGPIKYIAALAYSEDEDTKVSIEKAVRFIIILLVSVFDPMAVLLIIAANYNLNLLARKNDFFYATTIDPVPMERDEIDAHRMYHRDQDSM